MKHASPSRLALALAGALAAAACSSSPPPPEGDASQGALSTSAPAEDNTGASTEESNTGSSNTDGGGESGAAGETVVRPADSPIIEGSNWLAHGAMSETMVKLIWSEVEGDSVNYRVYRVKTLEVTDLVTLELGQDLLSYQGPDTTFVDFSGTPHTFYTYLLEVDVDGQTLARRWTETLTTTDTEPPSPIMGLTAESTPEGVLLHWEPSSDSVEFASYSVSIDIDGELTYIGGGGDIGQTSFLDDRPSPGANTYLVRASDFHGNRTDPASVTVDAG